jgi:hypothetical protein
VTVTDLIDLILSRGGNDAVQLALKPAGEEGN